MTDLYLAFSNSGSGRKTFAAIDWDTFELGVLVSFFYIDGFRQFAATVDMRPKLWKLDSGAFSAWASGKTIDMDALMEECRNPLWGECVALDVVQNPQKSLENALKMQAAGCKSYPVFHVGEPMEFLDEYVRCFPKVGLSCRFGEPVTESFRFLERCFSRHWPKKYHSFGWVQRRMLLTFPFESADTATWNNGPARWGRWVAWGCANEKMPGKVKGNRDLRAQLPFYTKLQRECKWRWKKEMELVHGA